MSTFLLKLLELSLQAGILTVAILLIRLVFRKLPAKYLCILWMIVAARLVIPFSVESSVAPMWAIADFIKLFPGDGEISGEFSVYHEETQVFLPEENVQNAGEKSVTGAISGMDTNAEVDYYITDDREGIVFTETEEMDYYIPAVKYPDGANEGWMQAGSEQIRIRPELLPIVAGVWVTGLGILLLYGVLSCFRVRRMVKNAIPYKENVRLCEELDSPFLFGWIHPMIYLPTSMEEAQMKYVIEHEKSHIARGDHYAKLVGYLLLAVYWFNPLLWIAYVMFCKDVERACDERVIAGFDVEERKGYAEALLQCSADCKFALSHPLAFGETDVKKRIIGILQYRKAGRWLTVFALLICVAAVAGCFIVQGENDGQEQQETHLPSPKSETPTPTPTPVGSTPTETVGVTLAPLPPSDLTLLGNCTKETVLPVPMGQTVTVDLNGDGTEESVTFGIEGYEGTVSFRDLEEAHKYTYEKVNDLYYLKINDRVWSQPEIAEEFWDSYGVGTTTYYIFDVDVSDGYKEIGIYFPGPNTPTGVALFRFAEGELHYVGNFMSPVFESDERNYEAQRMTYEEMVTKVERENYLITVPGDGTILCKERRDCLETSFTVLKYELYNVSLSSGRYAQLREVIRDRYEFFGWQEDRGEFNVRAAKTFTAYHTPVDMSQEFHKDLQAVKIPEGTRISFYAYYPDNGWTTGWVQFAYGENLEKFAWLYKGVDATGRFLIYLPNATEKHTDDLFENLSAAG